jgi:acid phosphatase (class A)
MAIIRGIIRAGVMVALLLMSGCAGKSVRPGGDSPYSIPIVFDVTRLLPPPPAEEAALARDLEGVHAAQRSRTPEQAAQAEATSSVDVFLFASVLGPNFTPERVPTTAAFLRRVYASSIPYLQATKNCWNRLRPFVVDPTLAPLTRSLASTQTR